MFFKKSTAALLAALMTASLAACGASSTPESAAAPAPAGSAAEATGGYTTDSLVVNIWDTNQQAGLQQIADEWSAQSGVDVKVEVISWVEYWTLLEAGASGGALPDVFWMHINEAQKYMGAEMLLNLNDYIAGNESIDMTNYYEGIVDIYSLNGNQYAVPKDHDTISVLYNKSIFDKYGIAYPDDTWTWDDYADAAAAITEAGKADGIYGTAMNTNDGQDGWYNLIYGFGGNLISDDKTTSGMDNENTVKAMKWLAERLIPSMPPQPQMAETDPDVLFQSGIIGMMMQGSWMVNTFYSAENSADYAWAQIPYYDTNGNGACDAGERLSMYNGLGWAAAANTKDPQAAFDLIAAFTSKEGQLKQSELGVTMAAYKGCSDAFIDSFQGMDLAPFIEIEKNGTLIQHPYSKYTTAWEGMFTTDLVDGWLTPQNMEAVCKDVAAKMNDILKDEQ